ncbi:hypothetical protein EDB19DRAFT_1908244 [Suillus lakei]|nr:hypothetical protein EDB19DRAFT_1908244 [Suillus lakei]
MKEQPNAPNLKKTNLCMVRKHVEQCWENESADVKEEILRLAREMREAGCEAAKKRELPKVTDELIILRLTEILSTFFGELHEATGWTFSVLLSSPDPSNGAEAAILKEMAAQSLKGQDLLRFSTTPDNILTMEDSPTTILPDISRPPSLPLELAPLFPSAAPEADFFGNLPLTHQHNETGKESDLPILPMPEGYIPPPPPPLPSPSTSMFFDLNFDSLDNAFCEMESQDAVTKMPNSPPCIHYQLDHLVWHSLPVLTASSAPFMSSPRMSTMTPSLVPTLTPAMSNSSTPAPTMSNSTTPATTPSRMMATLPATNIVLTPSPILSPAHVLPLAPPASKQSSGMTADPVSPLNTSNLDNEPPAKCRKKTQYNAVEPETLTVT